MCFIWEVTKKLYFLTFFSGGKFKLQKNERTYKIFDDFSKKMHFKYTPTFFYVKHIYKDQFYAKIYGLLYVYVLDMITTSNDEIVDLDHFLCTFHFRQQMSPSSCMAVNFMYISLDMIQFKHKYLTVYFQLNSWVKNVLVLQGDQDHFPWKKWLQLWNSAFLTLLCTISCLFTKKWKNLHSEKTWKETIFMSIAQSEAIV